MLPLPVAALYLVYVERSTTWRQVGAWVVRAGILTVPVCVAGLVKASAGSSSLQTNLAESETPSAISLASSWSETWRGLGFWLSYWINERGPSKPQTADYLVSVPLVLAAFAVPVVALLTFWHSRWRPRIFFAALILIALPIMVGAYPIDAPLPLGRFLLDVYDAIPPLYGFRNTYKAGPALLLGVAGLLAVAATAIFARASRRHRGVVVAGIGGVAGLVLWSFPFWTGDVYARPGMSEVPTYYRSAISWLDDQPGSGRALILPGSGFTVYRWGSPGDDIFDALMERTNVASTLRPRSAPESANLVNALYDVLDSGSDPEGAVPRSWAVWESSTSSCGTTSTGSSPTHRGPSCSTRSAAIGACSSPGRSARRGRTSWLPATTRPTPKRSARFLRSRCTASRAARRWSTCARPTPSCWSRATARLGRRWPPTAHSTVAPCGTPATSTRRSYELHSTTGHPSS